MKILLKDETPIARNPRRLAPKEAKIVDEQILQWLKDGVIVPSNSEFASQVVVTWKKNGKPRVCIDYKSVNKVIVKEHFPIPFIEDLLDKLADAKYFCLIDLTDGFFHVGISAESRKYTSFVTPNGQFEFTRVPFGLCNSPPVFQR